MDIFGTLAMERHEQVLLHCDPATEYRGIIAIHDTTLGPAMGGTRYWTYAREADALADAVRLARSMTYKAAAAGVPLGGGMAVVLRAPGQEDREALFRTHGRFVNRLRGRYITAEDAGTSVADMEHVRRETRHVIGIWERSGDPGPLTALGVFRAIQAAALAVLRRDTLDGVRVAVEGLGSVGYHLCGLLATEGACLTVSDLDRTRIIRVADEYSAQPAPVGRIRHSEVDVFAPCALGDVVTPENVAGFACRIIAGSANNQLQTDDVGDTLARRGIVYLPDYVINAGGLLSVARELFGWGADEARGRTFELHDRVLDLIDESRRTSLPPHRIANVRVQQVLRSAVSANGHSCSPADRPRRRDEPAIVCLS
jgi:leucine dehydrogenase